MTPDPDHLEHVTTGRTGTARTGTSRAASPHPGTAHGAAEHAPSPVPDPHPTGPVQPGSDPARPVNPDAHGVPGAPQETAASRLEKEAQEGEENRY